MRLRARNAGAEMSAPDYKAFARWCIKEAAGSDVDGCALQERAIKCGIVREVPYDPEKHGENDYDAEPGDPWLEFVEAR
jgi:hypothetical protein